MPKRPKSSDRPYPNVADALTALRTNRARITQEEMARRVGLTLSGYRTYEQGKRNLSQDQIPVWARALGVPVYDLTRLLWPDEQDTQLVKTRYSTDFAELQREIADLPEDQQERIMRGFWHSIEIAKAGDLARRN